ncbi:MAG TPA: ASKHA domain-containing protein [Phycisphaerae bacterium]|nr:ASKHA domain-containing protein [Phycisphaerae bacterium]
MPERMHRVVFEPDGRTLSVPDGQTLLEAARAAGIHLEAPCGGKGTCGGCRVIIPDNPPEPSATCRIALTGEEIGRNLRLACQVRVRSDLRVVIPEETRRGDQKILTDGVAIDVPLVPNVRKVTVHLPEPSVADQRSDADRLLDALAEKGLADLTLDVRATRDLPTRLRSLDFHPAVVVVGREIIHLDRPATADACYGIAFDVGTTTLVGYLTDLVTGEVVAVASRANPQAAYGDDVIARIEYCGRVRSGARTLQTLVVDALNEIVRETCRRTHIRPTVVYEATMVGNTTMNHLFLRLATAAIARAPFVAASASAHTVPARDVGLKIHPAGRLYTGPLVAGFVGADTVGVILATGMHDSDRLRLAIDIGTNGEIVLGTRDRLLACSTAAGPALEGARIRYGMRAAGGAIDRVDIDDGRLHLHTIDDEPPLGLCGTGLIDAVAVLLASGVIDKTGLMRSAADLAGAAPGLARRLIGADGERAFVLADRDETETGHPILLTQRDVREVQLAKGAIAAGVETLLDEFGAGLGDVQEVLLAGAFGNFIRPDRAQAVGLIPLVPADRVRFVGNAAGAGARLLLVNRNLRHVASEVARGVEHVELSQRADFQMRFAEAMFFPAAG